MRSNNFLFASSFALEAPFLANTRRETKINKRAFVNGSFLSKVSSVSPKNHPFVTRQMTTFLRGGANDDDELGLTTAPSWWTYDSPCTSMEWTPLNPTQLQLANDVNNANLEIYGVYTPPKNDDDDDDDGRSKRLEPPKMTSEEAQALLETNAKLLQSPSSSVMTPSLIQTLTQLPGGLKAFQSPGTTTPTLRIPISNDNNDTIETRRIVLISLGPQPTDSKDDDEKKSSSSSSTTTASKATGFALGKALAETCQAESGIESCALILPSNNNVVETTTSALLWSTGTSFLSHLYSDNRYRSGKNIKKMVPDLKTLEFVLEDVENKDYNLALQKAQSWAEGVYMTKDIVNAPHNVLNSVSLVDTAKRIAAESVDGCMTCRILDKAECEALNMGAFLGVARGSETEPYLIHLTYKTNKKKNNVKKLGIIGKGLLFDTGGYNIKTAMMELMKFDCGGAAAVLGAARAISQLHGSIDDDDNDNDLEVHFVVAACENMVDAKSYVPSDVLVASNGISIEVENTDAEGRLTLADALVYVDRHNVDAIIELSTLTGACMVSLGLDIAGLWTKDDGLANDLKQAAEETADKVWRMPLEQAYNDQLKSSIADLKNVGTRYGGAITAALFLQHFVESSTPFCHLDIAGPVWNTQEKTATGFGSKLVTEWILQHLQNKEEEK